MGLTQNHECTIYFKSTDLDLGDDVCTMDQLTTMSQSVRVCHYRNDCLTYRPVIIFHAYNSIIH